MIFVFALISLFIAWIWFDYFRRIDIFEKEKLYLLVIQFILGAGSVGIVFWLQYLFIDRLNFQLNGNFINDFIYSFIQIGMVEELSKLLPTLLILLIFRKQLNEPLDYIVFASISALGFAAVENTMYFEKHGANLIIGRSILSTIGHVFNAVLIAYGFVLHRFKKSNLRIAAIPLFFILGSLTHGIYDFWLIYEATSQFGYLITVVFFFFTLSIFATILNNCINNSMHFSYKKVIHPHKLAFRLLASYGIVLLIELGILLFFQSANDTFVIVFSSLIFYGIIIVVTVLKLSRFSLFHGFWAPLKLEFPFSVHTTGSFTETKTRMQLRIKGENYNESYINPFIYEHVFIHPISNRVQFLKSKRIAYMTAKKRSDSNKTYFVIHLYDDDSKTTYKEIHLHPKTTSPDMYKEQYPLLAVIEPIQSNGKINYVFREWAYLTAHSTQ